MSYSLFELNEFIRQVLALNFGEPIWVKCELAQVKVSRGHCYLDLVEKNGEQGEVTAQGNAVIWHSTLVLLRKKRGLEMDALLREGMEVLMLARVEYHERYGLKLMVEDFDPAYTLGKLELQKQATLRRLHAAGLLEKNRMLPLPPVIQRVAVLSSETAAGLQDFTRQLAANAYRFHFDCQLFPVAVQGTKVAEEVIAQLEKIHRASQPFDLIVVIRGGGSKLDLAAFDDFGLCEALAKSPLPVVTGIGHDVDATVLDAVAHTSLKTPTAVAEYLVQHNARFENALLELALTVRFLAGQVLLSQKTSLVKISQTIEIQSLARLKREQMMLDFLRKEIPVQAKFLLKKEKRAGEVLEKTIHLLSPETAYRRGFSLTTLRGKPITSSAQVSPGDEVVTQVLDGSFTSIVKKRNDG